MRTNIKYIRVNWNLILCTIIVVIGLGIATVLYAASTQSYLYSQEIPQNMVCLRDKYPDSYYCSPNQKMTWFIKKEGVLAHVK